MVLPTCPVKNLRWTARGRTWSSPPCSVRTLSILLVVSLSMPAFRIDKFSAGPNAGIPC